MLWLLLVVFFAIFTQTVSGFALGLILMPVLSAQFGLDDARPLMALIAVTSQAVMMVRTRQSLSLRTVGLLSIMGLLGIPVGNWFVEARVVSEQVLLFGLGIIILGYALYALFQPTMPQLKDNRWSSVVGLVSGFLSGAYNVGGPPVVVYANMRGWTPDEMRANLQTFFLFKGVVLLVVHAMSNNFTPVVWRTYAITLPVIAVGMIVGFVMYARIDEGRFRKIVLVLLVFTGLSMLV